MVLSLQLQPPCCRGTAWRCLAPSSAKQELALNVHGPATARSGKPPMGEPAMDGLLNDTRFPARWPRRLSPRDRRRCQLVAHGPRYRERRMVDLSGNPTCNSRTRAAVVRRAVPVPPRRGLRGGPRRQWRAAENGRERKGLCRWRARRAARRSAAPRRSAALRGGRSAALSPRASVHARGAAQHGGAAGCSCVLAHLQRHAADKPPHYPVLGRERRRGSPRLCAIAHARITGLPNAHLGRARRGTHFHMLAPPTNGGLARPQRRASSAVLA
eukprot:227833-Chlamydomonas_euryale.AAC.4